MKVAWLLVALLVTRGVVAHRVDDLLQAAFVEITAEEARVQVHLNPGTEVADKLIWLIDRNGDKQLSQSELERFAKDFISKTTITLDSKPLEVRFITAESDDASTIRSGNGNVHITLGAKVTLTRGDHLLRFENKNLPEWSAYLVNATLPKDAAIQIVRQERSDTQNIGKISFSLREIVTLNTFKAH